MSRATSIGYLLAAICLGCQIGCSPTQPFYFHDDGDMSHYKEKATEIEYPDVHINSLAEVECAHAPMTVERLESMETWPLRLEECLQIALANAKTIRLLSTGGQDRFFAGQQVADSLLRTADSAMTVYHPALQESDPVFGVEGALAAFDAQWNNSLTWTNQHRPQNSIRVAGAGGAIVNAFQPRVLNQDGATFQSELAKQSAAGTRFAVSNTTNYTQNNLLTRDVASDWFTSMQAEVRQPLLRGFGMQFNRIAGPGTTLGPQGTYRGVVIARINQDIALADFEAQVHNMASDVERYYRELYYQYRVLDARKETRDRFLESWRRLTRNNGDPLYYEARARKLYYDARADVETALWSIFSLDSKLRYLMGLAPTDCRLIRPLDEPTNARVNFEWCDVQAEALCRQVNLRRQRWRIKQREMELIASRNFLLPQLDAVARYRLLGLGDDLLSTNRNPFNPDPRAPLTGTDAFSTLTSGKYAEWDLGFTFSMPLGFRRELAAVRHQQLQLARERAILQDQELEVTHNLSDAVRNMEYQYNLLQTNYNRMEAASEAREEAEFYRKERSNIPALDSDIGNKVGINRFDASNEAERELLNARLAYFRSLVDYNESIKDVHYRKGSLLEYNNVSLSEGPWPAKAYFDARKRAHERDAGLYLDYGFSRPQVISRGPVMQHSHAEWSEFDGIETLEPTPAVMGEGLPQPMQGEQIAPPAPDADDQSTAPQFDGARFDGAVQPASFEEPVGPTADERTPEGWQTKEVRSKSSPAIRAAFQRRSANPRHETQATEPPALLDHGAPKRLQP